MRKRYDRQYRQSNSRLFDQFTLHLLGAGRTEVKQNLQQRNRCNASRIRNNNCMFHGRDTAANTRDSTRSSCALRILEDTLFYPTSSGHRAEKNRRPF